MWNLEIWKFLSLYVCLFTLTQKDFHQNAHHRKQTCYRTRKCIVLQACAGTFQPGNFTGWGSEGVKRESQSRPDRRLNFDSLWFLHEVLQQQPEGEKRDKKKKCVRRRKGRVICLRLNPLFTAGEYRMDYPWELSVTRPYKHFWQVWRGVF